VGRDNEYLKAPFDAIKVSLFGKWANLDIVYTPQFDPRPLYRWQPTFVLGLADGQPCW
jgi:hypothetical protein